MKYKKPLILCLDTETTGLDQPQAIQIAFKVLELNSENASYQLEKKAKFNFKQYFQPTKAIEPAATVVHGMDREKLDGQPCIHSFNLLDVLEEGLSLNGYFDLDEVYMVGHNISFDLNVLKNSANPNDEHVDTYLTWLDQVKLVDTLKIARNHFNFESNRLSDIVVNQLGVCATDVEDTAHDAMNDVNYCVDVLNWMIQQLKTRYVWTFDISAINNLEILSRRISKEQYGFLQSLVAETRAQNTKQIVKQFSLDKYTQFMFPIDVINDVFSSYDLPKIREHNSSYEAWSTPILPEIYQALAFCHDQECLQQYLSERFAFSNRSRVISILNQSIFCVCEQLLDQLNNDETTKEVEEDYYKALKHIIEYTEVCLLGGLEDHLTHCNEYYNEWRNYLRS